MELATFDQPGTIVLSVNQRLSGWLIQRYEQESLDVGKQAWSSPDILSFNNWLHRCWAERFDRASQSRDGSLRLLTPFQSELVWEDIIRSDETYQLLNPSATARSVASAWSLANAWQIFLSAESTQGDPDVQAFIGWKDEYVTRSQREHWLDQARLPQHLASLFSDGILTPPKRLLLAGFDQLTPQQQHLMNALRALGTQVDTLQEDPQTAAVQCLSFADARSEMNAVARWARAEIEQQPEQRIGIIVLDLQQRRDEVERVFHKHFYPAALFAEQTPDAKSYNLSLGRPLIDYPIIEVAMAALRCLMGRVPWQDISHLLRSVFMPAQASERSHRAMVEAALRSRGQTMLTLQHTLSEIERKQQQFPDFCIQTKKALTTFLRLRQEWPSKQSTADWARCLSAALSGLAWPGDRALDSIEYQTSQAWLDVLQQFSSLSGVMMPIPLDEALRLLNRLLRNTIFQPESVSAPIQIMGGLESAGQQFDAVWITGMTQTAWPPIARPNPYLPLAAQRSAGVPEASPDGQYQMAVNQTENWIQSAPTVRFSWPLQDEGQMLSGSSLLQPWSLQNDVVDSVVSDDYEQTLYQSGRLESIEDDFGPAVDTDEPVRGGVAIFRDQSACPFKAFAQHRLAAFDLEEPESGLDPRERGSLVHRCLENVWLQLKDQASLKQLGADELITLVNDVVTGVVMQEAAQNPSLRGPFEDIERVRLTHLLLEWLQLDAEREAFDVLDAEKRTEIQVGLLKLKVSVDRIDRLADGSLAIIDYKTGECSHKDWFDERPKDPQLPLYGCFGMEAVSSLAFGRVKKGKLAYEGVTGQYDHFSALKALDAVKLNDAQPDWTAQQAVWRQRLTRLADEFVAGDARVDPMPKACDYCHLDALCRVRANPIEEDDATD